MTAPDPPPAPAPTAPPPAPADATSQLLAENAQLRSWKAQADAEAARRTEAARLDEHRKLADQGEIEKLVQKHEQERAATAETHKAFVERARRTELDRALALALSGKPLMAFAPAHLARLWRDDFEVSDGPNGEFVVRSRGDLKTPDQVVAERLASPEYANFVRADARGGGGASGGGNPAPSNNPADQAAPRTYEEAVIATWKANQEAAAQGPAWVRGHPFKFPGK